MGTSVTLLLSRMVCGKMSSSVAGVVCPSKAGHKWWKAAEEIMICNRQNAKYVSQTLKQACSTFTHRHTFHLHQRKWGFGWLKGGMLSWLLYWVRDKDSWPSNINTYHKWVQLWFSQTRQWIFLTWTDKTFSISAISSCWFQSVTKPFSTAPAHWDSV